MTSVGIKIGQALRNLAHKRASSNALAVASAPIFAGKQKQDAKATNLVIEILDCLMVKSLRVIMISAVARVKIL